MRVRRGKKGKAGETMHRYVLHVRAGALPCVALSDASWTRESGRGWVQGLGREEVLLPGVLYGMDL